ncbi:hypothetical protein ACHWQZ_G004864 [Mnemiopsis leidyi]
MTLERLKSQLSRHVENTDTARQTVEWFEQQTTASTFGDEVTKATRQEVLDSCFPVHVHTELYSTLAGISAVLQRHAVEHWLCFGSAIGALRHGTIVPWDDDIDMVMWWSDLDKLVELEEELREAGVGLSLWWANKFQVWTTACIRAYLLKEKLQLKFDGKTPLVTIDIFFVEQRDGAIRYTHNQFPRSFHDPQKFYPLRPVKLGPVSTFLPSDAAEALASEYGARWDKEAFLQILDHITLKQTEVKYDEKTFEEFQYRLRRLEAKKEKDEEKTRRRFEI